jgi:putative ABC transport system permease protein
MKFKDGFRLASQGLKRRKGRTFLTSLAVAVGTMLVVTMVSIGTSGENLVLKEIDNAKLSTVNVYNYKYFDIYNEDSIDIDVNDMFKKIDDSTVKELNSIKGVDTLTAISSQSVNSIEINGKKNNNRTVINASNDNRNIYSREEGNPIAFGRDLKKSDESSVVLGREVS